MDLFKNMFNTETSMFGVRSKLLFGHPIGLYSPNRWVFDPCRYRAMKRAHLHCALRPNHSVSLPLTSTTRIDPNCADGGEVWLVES